MKIEEQVLSMEQMKHLQELGVDTSDASMCWLDFEDNEPIEVAVFVPKIMLGYTTCKVYPTYTIGDLIEKLPNSIDSVHGIPYNRKILIEGEYTEVCYTNGGDYCPFFYSNSTLINLLYNLLCELAKNHKELLKVKK